MTQHTFICQGCEKEFPAKYRNRKRCSPCLQRQREKLSKGIATDVYVGNAKIIPCQGIGNKFVINALSDSHCRSCLFPDAREVLFLNDRG